VVLDVSRQAELNSLMMIFGTNVPVGAELFETMGR
jgi:hypothetical protein